MKKMALFATVLAAGALSLSTACAQQSMPQSQQQSPMSGASGSQASDWTQNQQVVRDIQQALNNQGFDAGDVDGMWGPRTQAALRNFEQSKGMQADGQLDQETMAALGVDASAAQQQGFGSTGGGQPPMGQQDQGSGGMMGGSRQPGQQ
ncbi:MAG TPA: peptidoglycan-binding domain-containing protein [Azospirillaceae bacterium]|nr:peptidoglycan-binding domain-containing protein [Azospirillaceae bacterium]